MQWDTRSALLINSNLNRRHTFTKFTDVECYRFVGKNIVYNTAEVVCILIIHLQTQKVASEIRHVDAGDWSATIVPGESHIRHIQHWTQQHTFWCWWTLFWVFNDDRSGQRIWKHQEVKPLTTWSFKDINIVVQTEKSMLSVCVWAIKYLL